jgi:hypothetical protein
LHAGRNQPGLLGIIGNISAHSFLSFTRAEMLPEFSHRLVREWYAGAFSET